MKNYMSASFLGTGLALMTAMSPSLLAQVTPNTPFQRVLLISIDGMHAVDFANCGKGIAICPNMQRLASSALNYYQASTPKPSDSFPGLAALITGGSPRTHGLYYDVSYDRYLAPPAKDTPYGISGGTCPGNRGTQVGFDEQVDNDLTKLDGGGGINPNYLPRDPYTCKPVYPHNFIRANTIFEVVKANGGYTAWSDKHPSYEWANGPSGTGINDFWSPEINSNVVPLPQVPGCSPLPDQTALDGAWTDSLTNITCYDQLKVQAILNQIDGKTHDGSASAPVPSVFGMNFQSVSVGQKLVEKSNGTQGGYLDAAATPSPALAANIQYVDGAIGQMVAELKKQGLYQSTLIIITAKHGQSPINPAALLRIPGDNKALTGPSDLLGKMVAQSDDDDVSLIWLNDQNQAASAVQLLQQNINTIGGGEIFWGNSMNLLFGDPAIDSRVPDIAVAPNVGVVYTGKKKKLAEHGGFAADDTNVILLLSAPSIQSNVIVNPVTTMQVAPTILKALGIDPKQLQGVQKEGTQVLPGLPF